MILFVLISPLLKTEHVWSMEDPFQGVSFNLMSTGTVYGEGNGTPLQYSCLENPMDGGAWWAVVCGVAKNRAQLSD